MNKKIIIILVAILVVLLAAIAVIELIKPEKNEGFDSIIVNSNGETGAVVDLETGSIIEETSNVENVTSNNKVAGNEVVGEQNMSENVENSSTDKNSSETTSSEGNTSSTDPNKQTMEGFDPWK